MNRKLPLTIAVTPWDRIFDSYHSPLQRLGKICEKYYKYHSSILSNFSIFTTDLSLAEENNSAEIFRLIHVIVRPILITGGTVGNVLTLYITRRTSLKNVSTCFYMFLLALADTSKWVFSLMSLTRKTSECSD